MSDLTLSALNGEAAVTRSEGWFLALLTGIASLISLPFLFIPLFWTSSEAREAHVVRTILQTEEWVLPLRNGLIPSKPPLFHWFSAFFGMLVGSSDEWLPRFTSLFFSMGVIAVTCALVVGTLPRRNPLGTRGAILLTTAMLTTIYGFVQMMAVAMVDMTFCFFSTLALFFPLRSLARELHGETPEHAFLNSEDRMLFFLFVSYAILSRGPLGIVLPTLILLACSICALGVRRGFWAVMRPHWSWCFPVLLAGFWYFMATERGGMAFLQRQIGFENVERFMGGEHINSESPWFYIPSFLRTAMPWSLLSVIAVVQFVRRTGKRDLLEAAGRGARWGERLGSVWFLAGVLFLSLSSGKRHSYLLPLFPGFVWALTLYLVRIIDDHYDTFRKIFLRPGWHLLIAGFALALAVAGELATDVLPVRSPITVGSIAWLERYRFVAIVILFLVTITQIAACSIKPRYALVRGVILWAAILVLEIPIVYGGRALKGHWKGYDQIAQNINALVPAGGQMSIVRHVRDETFDVLLYYLNRDVTVVSPDADFGGCSGTLLARRDWWESHSGLGWRIDERTRFRTRFDAITGDKERDVVLLQCHPGPSPKGFV